MLYYFKCPECENEIEREFSMKDKPKTVTEVCESCGNETEHTGVIKGAPGLATRVGTNFKGLPTDFKSTMDAIKKKNPDMKTHH